MSILEMIVKQSVSNEAVLEVISYEKYWVGFKRNSTKAIESNSTQLLAFRDLWGRIQKDCPNMIPIMVQYYLCDLDQFINYKLYTQLSNINNLQVLLYNVHKFAQANEAFMEILKGKEIIGKFRIQIASLLSRLGCKQKLSNMMNKAYRSNCLSILGEDIIDFDADVKSYIIEKCKNKGEETYELKSLSKCLQIIYDLNILDEFLEPLMKFFSTDSQQFIREWANTEQNKQFLSRCLNYCRTFQRGFCKKINSPKTQESLMKFINKIQENIYFLCAKLYSVKILDIVLEFPQSYPIILQLKKCVDRTHLLGQLAEKLIKGVEKRLLIPGVITQTILNQYINMLKVLQIIDPQGIIFDSITQPIKNYLLKRNDTLRCIISHLTDDGENYSKLTLEVVKIPSKEYIDDMSSEEDENAAEKWEILPVKETKTKVRVKYQEIDLVTVLVNLYGSQQAFINQYQNMLAEKLMSTKDYSIDQEIKNIELLKKRFGQSSLQTCNIIVKDVKDSKRNDNTIHNQATKNSLGDFTIDQMNCLAVSKGYWPINYEASNTFSLPPSFKPLFDEYALIFSKIKAMRKIFWHYNFGHVNLTLTFENGSFDFKCLPIHAVLITYFDETKLKDKLDGCISSEELGTQLNIPHHIVKQKMSFWVHKEVVKEVKMPKAYLSLRRIPSIEDSEAINYKPVNFYESVVREDLNDDPDNYIVKESTSMQSHLRHIIEGLIISILNINGPKSPEKIHLLLKTVYKTDLDYTYGEAQTLQILKKMSTKKKIHFNGQLYSSKHDNS